MTTNIPHQKKKIKDKQAFIQRLIVSDEILDVCSSCF